MMGWQEGSEGKMLHANSSNLSAILRTYSHAGRREQNPTNCHWTAIHVPQHGCAHNGQMQFYEDTCRQRLLAHFPAAQTQIIT